MVVERPLIGRIVVTLALVCFVPFLIAFGAVVAICQAMEAIDEVWR